MTCQSSGRGGNLRGPISFQRGPVLPPSPLWLHLSFPPHALRHHSCANTLQRAGDGGRYRCHRPLTQAAFVCAAPRRPAGTELPGPSLTPRNTGKSMRTHNCLLTTTMGPFISSLLSFCRSSDLFLQCSRPVGSEPTQDRILVDSPPTPKLNECLLWLPESAVKMQSFFFFIFWETVFDGKSLRWPCKKNKKMPLPPTFMRRHHCSSAYFHF